MRNLAFTFSWVGISWVGNFTEVGNQKHYQHSWSVLTISAPSGMEDVIKHLYTLVCIDVTDLS